MSFQHEANEHAKELIQFWKDFRLPKELDKDRIMEICRELYRHCGIHGQPELVAVPSPAHTFHANHDTNHVVRRMTHSEYELLMQAENFGYMVEAHRFYRELMGHFGHQTRPDIPHMSVCWGNYGFYDPFIGTYIKVLSDLRPNARTKHVELMWELSQLAFDFSFTPSHIYAMVPPSIWTPHNANGPCLKFGDGYELAQDSYEAYALQGITVPKRWVQGNRPPLAELHTLNPAQIMVVADQIGWTDVFPMFKDRAKVVDQDKDPTIGTLWSMDTKSWGLVDPLQVVEVLCDTGRTMYLRVPPETRTALEAQGWLWDVSPVTYRPELQR